MFSRVPITHNSDLTPTVTAQDVPSLATTNAATSDDQPGKLSFTFNSRKMFIAHRPLFDW